MSHEPTLDKFCWGPDGDILQCNELLDEIIDSFHDPEEKPDINCDTSPGLGCNGDMFLWEDIKLSDTDKLFSNIEKTEPLELPSESEIPLSVLSSSEDGEDNFKGCATSNALLGRYGLSDEELSDITLKQLRSICKTEHDYNDLKAYRRTCQNRYYARSSRSKQQVKTHDLAKKLDQSEQKVARLQQENEMKDATIRCLQLELQILRSLTQE